MPSHTYSEGLPQPMGGSTDPLNGLMHFDQLESILHSNLFFVWDKYHHLIVCLILVEPFWMYSVKTIGKLSDGLLIDKIHHLKVSHVMVAAIYGQAKV